MYGVSFLFQSECGRTWNRITPNTDAFHAVGDDDDNDKNTVVSMRQKSEIWEDIYLYKLLILILLLHIFIYLFDFSFYKALSFSLLKSCW